MTGEIINCDEQSDQIVMSSLIKLGEKDSHIDADAGLQLIVKKIMGM